MNSAIFPSQPYTRSIGLLAGAFLLVVPTIRADVGPPVEITMPADTPMASDGQPYAGAFEMRIFAAGTLTDFAISGAGWTILSAELPTEPFVTPPTVLRIPFQAVPTDADLPIVLRLRFEGRPVRQGYEVGPRQFARYATPRPALRLPGTRGVRPDTVDEDVPRTVRADTVVVRGRIVYTRSGRDLNGDGDMNDPDDIAPLTVGADEIRVRVLDNDPVGDEEMWAGFTDELGYFVTPPLDADVDGDGSGPDLVLRVETFRDGWVDVTDNSFAEYTYAWESAEVTNYEGSEYDFGWVTPLAPDERAAIHIYNTVIRTRRFILEQAGYITPEVQVEWPTDAWSHYERGPVEIHLFNEHTWDESVVAHEYGHHFIASTYDPPEPDYNNGICDGGSPEGDCFPGGGTWSPGPGHCLWCRETDHDAWNEGWPNWLADVVLRDFPQRYVLDVDGSAYTPLFALSNETPRNCCVDGMPHDPLRTEGFIGALLRDIEDAGQDDHDLDGIRDQMCAGPATIFDVVYHHHPTTVLDFLDGYLADQPQDTDRLWPTAFNVGGAAYVARFPADTEPPGAVPALDSTTHPPGVGGSLPCIRFEFDPAPDDVTGAGSYSYTWTTNPAGQDPGNVANPGVSGTSDCRLTGVVSPWGLGTFYISIKAQDHAGNWSSQYATFGPFEIVDCNGSGLLDLCDIDCDGASIPDLCSIGTSPCFSVNCGGSTDCNGNFVPDECDIASGTSEDCNQDGVPDECQPMRHYTGAGDPSDQWALPGNWLDLVVPADGDHVCIRSGGPVADVTYAFGATQLASLACEVDFRILAGAAPWAELELDGPSFVGGDLTLSGNATLINNDEFDVGGQLVFGGGSLRGPGQTTVAGGMALPSANPEVRAGHHLTISGGSVNAAGRYLNLNDTAVFTLGAGVTYAYEGDFNIITGGYNSTFDNDGTLIRAAGDDRATISGYTYNAGLIHVQTGELYTYYGATHSGDVLGDPGTLLTFATGTYEFAPGSSLTGDDVRFLATANVRGAVDITDTLTIEGGPVTFTNEADPVRYGQRLNAIRGGVHFESPVNASPYGFQSVTIGQGNDAGNVHFDTGQPVSIDDLTLRSGTINGADPITIHDSFAWHGGGGFFAGGPVYCDAPSTIHVTSSQRTLSREFNNHAYATFLGQIGISGSGVYINAAAGTVELRGDRTGFGGGAVDNHGLIVKTEGAGGDPAAVGYRLTNAGTIHVLTGELQLGYFDSVNTGIILGEPGTTLRFRGSHEMQPGSRLIADDLYIASNTSNVRGDVDIRGAVHMNGGIWTFTDEAHVARYGHSLTVESGRIHFEAPAAAPVGFDSVVLGPGQGASEAYFDTGAPVRLGTLQLASGGLYGTDEIAVDGSLTFNSGTIASGGALTAYGPVTINANGGTRNLRRDFYNADRLTFVNGALAPANCDVINLSSGTIDIQTDSGAAFSLSTTATVHNHGLLLKSAGSGVSSINTHFRNAGTVEVRTGTLELYGSYSLTHAQTAGRTILNGGDLAVTSPGVFQLSGGDLMGVGTVTGAVDNVGGTVRPGHSAGVLVIDGDYAQQADGALAIELGGTAPGAFDVLDVTGTAALAGELHVTTIDGFATRAGDSFVIITAAGVSGTFDAIRGPGEFELTYGATAVTLHVTAPGLSGDLDEDCDIDALDFAIFGACMAGPDVEAPPPGANPDHFANADLDQDGDVDAEDFTLLQVRFGETCAQR